ncbi:tumor necrosis factor receptor superfamily member 8 isoform X1 [Equus caballus]|uniref:tumor necrosis factor receptor superfamily member 8 isoform X1 n=2 Tax=Equus caballus TaxID=9796 RepID=UPI0038B23BB1
MRSLRAALGLLLLGVLQALPQGQAPTDPCAGDPSRYHDEAAGKCCYRCPGGPTPQPLCPQNSSDCPKQCEPDYYLSAHGRCTACVSCAGDDLVEKKPCSWNSPRVCECRAGMFCATSATNSCARCFPHSDCPPGMIVKFQGTAEKDTICEPPSPRASPDCSTSPEDCEAPASDSTLQAKPALTSPARSDARTMLLGGGTPEEDSKMTRAPNSPSSVGKPSPDLGPTPQQPCPQGSADCRKQCEPDYYLERDGRCTACVSCAGDDLVEKTPCTWNSSRVCECRPGMFCATSATNSCARCVARPICPPGMVTKLQGAAERDTTDNPPPPGSHPNCSTNPEDREASASSTPSLADPQTSMGRGGGITHAWGDASILTSAPISFSSTGKPMLVSGPVLFWVIMTLVVVVGSSSFLLCHRRACRKWIRQKLHLCYPVRTFRPKLEPGLVDSRPRRKSPELRRSVSLAEPGMAELGLMSSPSPAVETCPSVGAAGQETLRLLEASPASRPSSPTGPPEPRVTTEHTNNRIEKIYIMKADTVIVGTVKTEVPEGRGLVGPAGPEFEEDLEVDHAPHYPEQETEPPLGSCGDVMFSVEEEGKEDPLPTTASGK